jgi:hypothetical protein
MDTAIAIVAGVALIVVLLAAIWLIRRVSARVPIPIARQRFEQDFAELRNAFFLAASTSGKPRGLIWKSCDFGQDVRLARDKSNGELLALVSVTIAFDAVPGGDMEGLPAVSNLRCATAVFSFRDGAWTTTGRAAFNLTPEETLDRFRNQYEPIEAT